MNLCILSSCWLFRLWQCSKDALVVFLLVKLWPTPTTNSWHCCLSHAIHFEKLSGSTILPRKFRSFSAGRLWLQVRLTRLLKGPKNRPLTLVAARRKVPPVRRNSFLSFAGHRVSLIEVQNPENICRISEGIFEMALCD